jgi:hypothetical protein
VRPSAHHGALRASPHHGARPLLPTGLPECHQAPSCDSHRQSMSIELPARLASVLDHAILDQAIVPKAAQIKHAVRRLPFWCSSMPRSHSCVLQALSAPQQVHES